MYICIHYHHAPKLRSFPLALPTSSGVIYVCGLSVMGVWVAVDYRARVLEKGRARMTVVKENETSRIKKSGGESGVFLLKSYLRLSWGGNGIYRTSTISNTPKKLPPFYF